MQIIKETDTALVLQDVNGVYTVSKRPPQAKDKAYVLGVRIDYSSGACVPIYNTTDYGIKILKLFPEYIEPYYMVEK